MKKMILTLAVLAVSASAAFAQDREIDLDQLDDLNKIELSKDNARAFQMYFGTSVLSNINYKNEWAKAEGAYPDFLDMRTAKNFVYGLQLASLNIRYNALEVSAGLR